VTGDKNSDYEKAGFDGTLVPGFKPVLLIIDPARAYIDPECPLYAGVEDVAQNIVHLKGVASALGIPVIVTRVLHDDKALNGGVFVRKVPSLKWLRPESPFSAYIEGLSPTGNDIEVVKQYASAFSGTTLAATLTAMGADTVVLAGFSTSGCIRASATDAMQLGFIPLVVREAVGDRLAEVHEANLFDIQAKIGEVVSSETVVELLTKTQQWPSP
jgi:maleamate amidohydrolase